VAGGVIALFFAAVALLAPWLAPHDPEAVRLGANLRPPSWAHPFGTDSLGRDVLSQTIYGARVSLTIGFVSLALALAGGVPVGALAAWAGGWVDRLTMRIVDVLVSFPTLLLAIIVITVFGPGLVQAMIAIGIAQVPLYARLTRSAVLRVQALDYVTAARAGGAAGGRILWRHVFPNCLSPLIVQSTLLFATAILSAAYLGFLGLGAQPPTPEWGTMLSKARDFLRVAPHVSIFPGVTIMLTVLGLNLLGDGLRDVLDPRTSPG
jgi:ABC-type dipeptide/oligopeptide/nickel transport system permease subunit